MENASLDNPFPIEEKPKKNGLAQLGWFFFFFFCLILFTFIKLPESRIKNYIQGTIASQLNPRGITLTAQSSELSFWFGVSYKMVGVTVRMPSPDPEFRMDSIEFSPSVLSLITGRVGGNLKIEANDGSLKMKFQAKGIFPADPSGKIDASTSFRFKNFNLGRIGMIPALTGFKAGAIFDGEGTMTGSLSDPSSFEGYVKLNLNKIQIDSQQIPTPIGSTSIPALRMNQGVIDIKFEKGKLVMNQFNLGKMGSNDDFSAQITGDAALGKRWDTTNLNVKFVFTASESISKQFSLDSLLKDAKRPDGSFSYQISGPINRPSMNPQP